MVKLGFIAVSLFKAVSRVNFLNHHRFSSLASSHLGQFDPNHHPCLRENYKLVIESWMEETANGGNRCGVCWNEHNKCCCELLQRGKEELAKIQESAVLPYPDINVHIYYHFKELGRLNTGHLLESLCPNLTTSSVHGDVSSENKLIDTIHRESIVGNPSTCILYPSKDAISLSEWMNARPNKSQRINLIALDGTYSTAQTLLKYLRNRCDLLNIKTPVVKLDFDGGERLSAIGDIKPQPRPDKICTYEAIVVAMQQVGVDPRYCDRLLQGLCDWRQHLYASRIRYKNS